MSLSAQARFGCRRSTRPAWRKRLSNSRCKSSLTLSERGVELNKQRMKKMKARNKYVEESFTESKKGLAQYFSENTDEYKELLK